MADNQELRKNIYTILTDAGMMSPSATILCQALPLIIDAWAASHRLRLHDLYGHCYPECLPDYVSVAWDDAKDLRCNICGKKQVP